MSIETLTLMELERLLREGERILRQDEEERQVQDRLASAWDGTNAAALAVAPPRGEGDEEDDLIEENGRFESPSRFV